MSLNAILNKGKKIFLPFESLNSTIYTLIIITEIIIGVYFWSNMTSNVVPSPAKVFHSFFNIIGRKEFINNVIQSIFLTIQGIGYSMIVALTFAYLSPIGVIKPIANLLSKFRYLTATGVTYVLVTISPNSHDIKMMLLLFGIIPFFTTSLLSIIADINKQEFELCKTMRMNRWEILWEVVIIGRLHLVFETMRQNFAIAWMMITMVEGIAMNEGGLGVMLITSARVLDMGNVFVILLIILCLGIVFDFLLKSLSSTLFPYYNK
jgi:ABC-type nitrate/sulfonate/bicarbonate transport system permease component